MKHFKAYIGLLFVKLYYKIKKHFIDPSNNAEPSYVLY